MKRERYKRLKKDTKKYLHQGRYLQGLYLRREVVEDTGFEPVTYCMPCKHSTN